MDQMIRTVDGGYAIAGYSIVGAGGRMYGWSRLMRLGTCSGTRPTEEQELITGSYDADCGGRIRNNRLHKLVWRWQQRFLASQDKFCWHHAVESDLRRNRH